MKIFRDLSYWTFSGYNKKIEVKCPFCGKLGTVSKTYKDPLKSWSVFIDAVSFQCASCGKRQEKEIGCVQYKADAFCKNCEYPFITDISNVIKYAKQNKVNVICPRCNKGVASASVRKIETNCYHTIEIENGADPHFNYPLYYQSVFKGKIVWALNRDHLQYLIDYISAELRIDPPKNFDKKTQADHLPTFMKLAKNRSAILKLLLKMQTL